MSSKFVFMTYIPPAVEKATKVAVEGSARGDEKATVLANFGKVSIPDDGDWYVAAVNLADVPAKVVKATGKMGKPRLLAKNNPYLLQTREQVPAEGTTYNLPLAWNGCRYMSRKVALAWAHAYNVAFKS